MQADCRILALAVLSCSWPLAACKLDVESSGPPTLPDASEMLEPEGGTPDASTGDGAAAPCAQFRSARQPFFGDLHVHSALSLDANLQGTRLRPMDTYRFARGEQVSLPPYDAAGNSARTLKLERPLDFVALSDHAEYLGLVTTCLTPTLPGYDSEVCVQYRGQPALAFIPLNSGLAIEQGKAGYLAPCMADNAQCGTAATSAWSEVKQAAAAAQDTTAACRFTSFVAYEWSASPGLRNLHRNVIFAGTEVPALPFSYFDGNQEQDLWDALERDCLQKGGCDVLTIPHNSNLSAGLMFEPVDRDGKPIDRAYAERRARFEPLVEIFQHKGSSECLPSMGADELCAFERSPYNNLGSAYLGGSEDAPVPSDYVRDALGKGLSLEKTLGASPFAYGFVGSTDSHLGTPGAVEEGAFAGHGGAGAAARTAGLVDNVWFNPGGLAVLWAEENSRNALFAAMKRREAYATSGSRITLRFFGGFDLPVSLCTASDFAEQGYQRGVPMGGDLRGAGKTLRFAVSALQDPGTAATPGVPLDRIQIVKGSIVADAVRYEVFDLSNSTGQASVDPATCQPTGRGAAELCNVWQDPSFDPAQPAFYYARVLENPSCRWHKRACLKAGVDCANPATVTPGYEPCCDAHYPATHQERAWSSPIFYHPQ